MRGLDGQAPRPAHAASNRDLVVPILVTGACLVGLLVLVGAVVAVLL